MLNGRVRKGNGCGHLDKLTGKIVTNRQRQEAETFGEPEEKKGSMRPNNRLLVLVS